jgi:hypothetical protein
VSRNIHFSAPSRFAGMVAILLHVPIAVNEGVVFFKTL